MNEYLFRWKDTREGRFGPIHHSVIDAIGVADARFRFYQTDGVELEYVKVLTIHVAPKRDGVKWTYWAKLK